MRQLMHAIAEVLGSDKSLLTRVYKRDFFSIMSTVKVFRNHCCIFLLAHIFNKMYLQANIVSKEDVDLIYTTLGIKEGDITVIDMNDYLKLLDASVVNDSKNRLAASQSDINLILESMRNRIQTNPSDAPLTSTGSRKISLSRLENAFQDACIGNPRDGKYNISKSAFSKALDSIDVHVRASDIDCIFSTYGTDKRQKDTINYTDFIDALTNSNSARSPRVSRSPRESASNSSPLRRTISSPASSPISRKSERK